MLILYKNTRHLTIILAIALLSSCGGDENDFLDFTPVPIDNDVVQIDSAFLNKRRVYAMTTESFITSRHFIVWWGRRLGNLQGEVIITLNELERTWDLAIDSYGMNPPPDASSFYTNIYFASTGDGIPEDLGTNVYFDFRNVPYITLDPQVFFINSGGANTGGVTISKKAFQVYISQRTSFTDPASDSWLTQAASGWFVQDLYPTNSKGLDPVAAYGLNPHLPLWSTSETLQAQQPEQTLTWSQRNHEAGAQILFTYLVENGIFTSNEIADFFKVDSDLAITEYLAQTMVNKGLNYQDVFSDFCSHNVTWDYSDHSEIYLNNQDFWASEGELNNNMDNSIVEVIGGNGTSGIMNSNPNLAPGGWAYNTYLLEPEDGASYNITFNGETQGTLLSDSDFRVIMVRNNDGQRVYEKMNMTNPQSGQHILNDTNVDEDIYLVIASIPNITSGYEQFNYSFSVTRL